MLHTHEHFEYFLNTARDRQWGLCVTGAGEVIDQSQTHPCDAHPSPYFFEWEKGRVLPFHAVLFISRGKGEFESEDTGKKLVTAGNVILLFPNVWHRYRAEKEIGWTQHWATFNGNYADRLIRQKFFSPRNPLLVTGMDTFLVRAYQHLFDHAKFKPPGMQQLLAADVVGILAAALGASEAYKTLGKTSEIIQQAKLFLEQSTDETVDLKKLAHSLGFSYNKFRLAFKENIGLAPRQYHLQQRITRAKELLHRTDFSSKQIAYILKFGDQYHFSHIFKKYVGVSPTQWRGHQP